MCIVFTSPSLSLIPSIFPSQIHCLFPNICKPILAQPAESICCFLPALVLKNQSQGSSLGKTTSPSSYLPIALPLWVGPERFTPSILTGQLLLPLFSSCLGVMDADFLSYINNTIRLLGPLLLIIFLHSVLVSKFQLYSLGVTHSNCGLSSSQLFVC